MSDLTRERDHALKMAGASATSATDAALWLRIAEEITAYLQQDEPVAGGDNDVPLFEEGA